MARGSKTKPFLKAVAKKSGYKPPAKQRKVSKGARRR